MEQRRELVLLDLTRYFGEKAIQEKIDYHEKVSHIYFQRGNYNPIKIVQQVKTQRESYLNDLSWEPIKPGNYFKSLT